MKYIRSEWKSKILFQLMPLFRGFSFKIWSWDNMIGILHNLKLSGKISTLKQIFSRTNLKSGIRNNVLVYTIPILPFLSKSSPLIPLWYLLLTVEKGNPASFAQAFIVFFSPFISSRLCWYPIGANKFSSLQPV